MSCETTCRLPRAWGVHFVLRVGVTVADVALNVVAAVVGLVV